MNLKAIKFCRFSGQKYEWSIEGKPVNGAYNQWVTFENINLIVGKNATGKSKTVNSIRQLADLLTGKVKLSNLVYDTSTYYIEFEDNGESIDYFLDFKNGKVKQEILKIGGIEKFNRGKGELYYAEIDKFLSFQMEDDKLAVTKVDSKQQPFFEPLYNWGKNLNFYDFKDMGKHLYIRDINAVKKDDEVDFKEDSNATYTFIVGQHKFSNFSDIIIKDMNNIGYNISTISPEKIKHTSVNVIGVVVQENDIDVVTDQREMSQGMFRALSLLIQLNYCLLSNISSCILIDDIGEGLDFDRSKSLIDLIIEKVKGSSVQLIMTTNDRFVMNKIPLEYWSVIHRIQKKSLFYNYKNSKEVFEEFKYTGLSNFDFLSTEFYFEGFENQEKI